MPEAETIFMSWLGLRVMGWMVLRNRIGYTEGISVTERRRC